MSRLFSLSSMKNVEDDIQILSSSTELHAVHTVNIIKVRNESQLHPNRREQSMNENLTTYPPLVSVSVAQTILGGRGRGRIYELITSEQIRSIKDGKRRMIVTESLFDYIKSLMD
jgi:hypothetical protein